MENMAVSTRLEIANILRRAAHNTVPEQEFWQRFRDWSVNIKDGRIMIAWEQAEHYWNNFHQRNIFLFRVKPDAGQLYVGREALQLLAKAFEEDWSEERMEKELHEI